MPENSFEIKLNVLILCHCYDCIVVSKLRGIICSKIVIYSVAKVN